MTISDLRALLDTYPPDMEVLARDHDGNLSNPSTFRLDDRLCIEGET